MLSKEALASYRHLLSHMALEWWNSQKSPSSFTCFYRKNVSNISRQTKPCVALWERFFIVWPMFWQTNTGSLLQVDYMPSFLKYLIYEFARGTLWFCFSPTWVQQFVGQWRAINNLITIMHRVLTLIARLPSAVLPFLSGRVFPRRRLSKFSSSIYVMMLQCWRLQAGHLSYLSS